MYGGVPPTALKVSSASVRHVIFLDSLKLGLTSEGSVIVIGADSPIQLNPSVTVIV
ncbi:hypothetical protein D3C86_2145680 [compost metagenome]